MRKIPSLMATQHPDNAFRPYWHHEDYIATNYEPRECYLIFQDLRVKEYKWDWEGKFVDESLVEKLVGENFNFFSKNQIGKNLFLTIRLPNPDLNTEFRFGRLFMNIFSASSLLKKLKLHTPAIFEIILPMTDNSEQMMEIQRAFREVCNLKHKLFDIDQNLINKIRIIPLFEHPEIIANSDKILNDYLETYKKEFSSKPPHLRPYVARSDPALNSGIVPTVLSIKIALSRYKKFEKKHNIKLYPIIGCACLPFRGGFSPLTYKNFFKTYKGIKTVTMQSAFRYDYPSKQVIKAVKEIQNLTKTTQPDLIDAKQEKRLIKISKIFEKFYQEIIEQIAPTINKVSNFVPSRRERVQHIGLFGYSRGVRGIKLPRAIKFTAALYSIGIVPEIIGLGQGLKKISQLGLTEELKKFYPTLKDEVGLALKYFNLENAQSLAKKNPVYEKIIYDFWEAKKTLKINKISRDKDQQKHLENTTKVLKLLNNGQLTERLIDQTAKLRKSIG
ncbi:MAG: phosphoenolpyruvate carboxylase [Candidatus Moranbacteria bacterium]|nr:phosphoenolpyruvate carboxylase [Candidatus Moranbacteria bacterium]